MSQDKVEFDVNGFVVPESGLSVERDPQHAEEVTGSGKEDREWLRDLREETLEILLDCLASQMKDAGPSTKASLQDRLISQNTGVEVTSLLSESAAEETVRDAALSTLMLPGVRRGASSLVSWLVHEQLFVNKNFDWTKDRTAQLLHMSLSLPYVRSSTAWLVDGLLVPGGVTDEPAITSALVSLPWSRPSIESALTWSALEALKWGGNRNMAKESFIIMLQSDTAQAAAHTAAEEGLKRTKTMKL